MTTKTPAFNTQVIGQAESALGAILDPLLVAAKLSFQQWLVLTLTSAAGAIPGGEPVGPELIVGRITTARKIDSAEVLSALDELAGSGLIEVVPGGADVDGISLTVAGETLFGQVRTRVQDITNRLFADLPADDLATAGRLLAIVTARANAEITAATG